MTVKKKDRLKTVTRKFNPNNKKQIFLQEELGKKQTNVYIPIGKRRDWKLDSLISRATRNGRETNPLRNGVE